MPVKLSVLVGSLLAVVSLVLVLYFPSKMESMGAHWTERRAVGLATFLATAVAPALEFDQPLSVEALFNHLNSTPEVLYAVVLKDDGSVWLSRNADRVPELDVEPSAETRVVMRAGALDVVTPIRALGGTSGTFLMGFSLAEVQTEVRANRRTVIAIVALVFLLALAATVLIGRWLSAPVRGLTQITANIVSAGDLTQAIPYESADEVGMLAETFRQMVRKLRSIPAALGASVNRTAQVVDKVSRTTNSVATGTQIVGERTRESTSLMNEMLQSLRDIAENVAVLHSSAERSAASNTEVVTLNEEMSNQVGRMVRAVAGTTAAIGTMDASIRRVSENVEQLSVSIEETSSTMAQMDSSIKTVEANAKHAASQSSIAAENAAAGEETVRKTIEGIENIRESSTVVSNTIGALGERISHVGKILQVINEVADQTNLLALNASIIAAQAGDSGRAFSVVADEIKELATRATASTGEIAALIKTIQVESSNAVAAVERGMASVNQGVALGTAASEAFARIAQSVHQSTSMIQAIATATIEQARSSSQITVALYEVSEKSQQIHAVTREQMTSSAQITASAQEMQRVTQDVEETTEGQRKRTRAVAEAVESIHEMARNLNVVQKRETERAGQVQRAVQSVEEVVVSQHQAVRQLEEALVVLRENASHLGREVGQFRT